jgi:hypothetical protein
MNEPNEINDDKVYLRNLVLTKTHQTAPISLIYAILELRSNSQYVLRLTTGLFETRYFRCSIHGELLEWIEGDWNNAGLINPQDFHTINCTWFRIMRWDELLPDHGIICMVWNDSTDSIRTYAIIDKIGTHGSGYWAGDVQWDNASPLSSGDIKKLFINDITDCATTVLY